MDIQQKRLIGAKILGGITLILMLISQPRYEISIDIIGFTLIVLSGGRDGIMGHLGHYY